MALLSYTSSIIGGTPEDVGQLNTMFGNVREVVNALDDDNIANGAGIQYSKLALAGSIKTTDLDAGLQVPWSKIVNPTGPVTINDSGVSALWGHVAEQSGAVTLSTDGSTYSSIVSYTPPAGTYVVVGKCRCVAQIAAHFRLEASLTIGGVSRDLSQGFVENTTFLNGTELVCMQRATVDGADLMKLMAVSFGGGGPGPQVQYGRLLMIRIA